MCALARGEFTPLLEPLAAALCYPYLVGRRPGLLALKKARINAAPAENA
jgi:hypothetical protein